jgi:hypothetical protein
MMSIKSSFLVILVLMIANTYFGIRSAHAAVLDFEGINTSGGTFQGFTDYGGLKWGGVLAVNMDLFVGPATAFSGRDAAGPGNPAGIIAVSSDIGSFDFTGAHFRLFLPGVETVTVEGFEFFNDVVPAFGQVVGVTEVWSFETFGFFDIERLVFTFDGPGSSNVYLIDDFSFSESLVFVPLPASFVYLGSVLFSLFGFVLRDRT